MKAARHPQGYAAVKLLVGYGADVTAMTSERHDHRTVLHYAVLSGNADIVRLLLNHGANVTFPPEFQKPTPLDFAILRGNVDMVRLLLDAGADVNAGSPIIGLPLHIALSEKVRKLFTAVSLSLSTLLLCLQLHHKTYTQTHIRTCILRIVLLFFSSFRLKIGARSSRYFWIVDRIRMG